MTARVFRFRDDLGERGFGPVAEEAVTRASHSTPGVLVRIPFVGRR